MVAPTFHGGNTGSESGWDAKHIKQLASLASKFLPLFCRLASGRHFWSPSAHHTQEERAAVTEWLRRSIAANPFPLSPRLKPLS